jgi:hypothetical protein
MNLISKNWSGRLLFVAIAAAAFAPAATRADVIMDWNGKADEIARP